MGVGGGFTIPILITVIKPPGDAPGWSSFRRLRCDPRPLSWRLLSGAGPAGSGARPGLRVAPDKGRVAAARAARRGLAVRRVVVVS